MLASAEAHDLEETLSNVEALLSDLVPSSPSKEMAKKKERIKYEIGHSRMNKMMLDHLESEGYFEKGRTKLPGIETMPVPPGKDYGVVFKDFFMCGLWFIPCAFLRDSRSITRLPTGWRL